MRKAVVILLGLAAVFALAVALTRLNDDPGADRDSALNLTSGAAEPSAGDAAPADGFLQDADNADDDGGDGAEAPAGIPQASGAPPAAEPDSGGPGGGPATGGGTASGSGSGGTNNGASVQAFGGDGTDTGAGLPPAQVLDRNIIRTANIQVTVENVGNAVQAIETETTAAGGFVSSSSFTVETPPQPAVPEATPAPQRQRATISIRVPAETYQTVLNRIRGLGEVQSVTSDTTEVTEEYTDLEARQRNLQSTEERYLELLGRAQTIPDILTVQDRLNQTRLEIEQVQGRLQLLDDLTGLATITVELALPPLVTEQQAQTVTEPGWAEEAWENAWNESEDTLETLGVAGITASVILVWVLVPAVLLFAGWRLFAAVTERKRPAS